MKLKQSLVATLLMVSASAANAQLYFQTSTVASRTETFDGIAGLPSYGLNTAVNLGTLMTSQAGYITFTYLGQESGYDNRFHLNVNGTHLFESNPIGTRASASIGAAGAVNFSFEGDIGRFANNGGSWASGTSIGLLDSNRTISQGLGAGTYSLILGYNDSAGAATLGDWDDFVVGVNFVAAPVPEPETYAMMMAGLGLLGFVGRRRKLKAARAA